jgi:hypothetical protein
MSQETAIKRKTPAAPRDRQATSQGFEACGKYCGKHCISCPHWFAQVDGEARHRVFDHLQAYVTIHEHRL